MRRAMIGRGESVASKGFLLGERGEVGLDGPGCWALTICCPTFRAAPAFACRGGVKQTNLSALCCIPLPSACGDVTTIKALKDKDVTY
jgi:hypothetical protein